MIRNIFIIWFFEFLFHKMKTYNVRICPKINNNIESEIKFINDSNSCTICFCESNGKANCNKIFDCKEIDCYSATKNELECCQKYNCLRFYF